MSLERCILGTAGLGGVWGTVEPRESVNTILLALNRGITAIDTAPAYGDAEMFIGEALKQWPGPRPQISTKVGRLKSYDATVGHYDYSRHGIYRSVEQSITTLGVPTIDILFLHDPTQIKEGEADRVIQTLISIKEEGLANKIGLGGNPPAWCQSYLQAGIFDVLQEYNKLNACNITALTENLSFCIDNNMQYFAASPLNMGLLGDKFESYVHEPPTWLNTESIEAAIHAREIASQNNMDLPELAHRFLLSLPNSFQIVIGASDRKQLLSTLTSFEAGALAGEMLKELLICSINKTA